MDCAGGVGIRLETAGRWGGGTRGLGDGDSKSLGEVGMRTGGVYWGGWGQEGGVKVDMGTGGGWGDGVGRNLVVVGLNAGVGYWEAIKLSSFTSSVSIKLRLV